MTLFFHPFTLNLFRYRSNSETKYCPMVTCLSLDKYLSFYEILSQVRTFMGGLHTWCNNIVSSNIPHAPGLSTMSQETHHHRTEWLQTCRLDVCGHEILRTTGVSPSERHYRPPAGPSAVCLPGKQVGGWCSEHGAALHPATPWPPGNLCQGPVCGL